MINFFSSFYNEKADGKESSIFVIERKELVCWKEKQSKHIIDWLDMYSFFDGGGDDVIAVPLGEGDYFILAVMSKEDSLLWTFSKIARLCPAGRYKIDSLYSEEQLYQASLGWGMGCYSFEYYKTARKEKPERALLIPNGVSLDKIVTELRGVYLCRDLINTPACHMMPEHFSYVFEQAVGMFGGRVKSYTGNALLKHNFPLVYAVGSASKNSPRLFDYTWGDESHPHVTLVGKGVCFDSGGLDLKPSSGMLLMKKDMGGAAHVLGLASMILEAKLPIFLRVIIPAVENAISGTSYRPGDVIISRKGLNIEITNTDAEGRLVLADALSFACEDRDLDLLIDFATLTGASRVALGAELPSFFVNDDKLAKDVEKHMMIASDPVWRMPLYAPYARMLSSTIADMKNCVVDSSYGGAITAALFLQKFVGDVSWMHFDVMAWNVKTEGGRIQGGEAQGVRGLFSYLTQRYQGNKKGT